MNKTTFDAMKKTIEDNAAAVAAAREAEPPPAPPKKEDPTEAKLAEMLRENTGRHFLDSGGAYGRNWERNQNRTFEDEPATTLSIEVDTYRGEQRLEVDVTHNVYHWLKERLTFRPEYDKAMRTCARFIRMANWRDGNRERELDKVDDAGRADYVWVERKGRLPEEFELAREFPRFFGAWSLRHNGDHGKKECARCDGSGEVDELELPKDRYGNYCEGDEPSMVACPSCDGRGWVYAYVLRYDQKEGFLMDADDDDYVARGPHGGAEPWSTNTYNHENALSQTLQFVSFTVNREEYVVLQVHGGCDVRGGYTDPVLFEGSTSFGEWAIHDYAKASLYCTDDGRVDLDAQIEMFPNNHDKADVNDTHSWYTDNGGHHFYGSNYERNLYEYPLVELNADRWEELAKALPVDVREGQLHLDTVLVDDKTGERFVKVWVKGKLCVNNAEKKAHCPHCGGTLAASSY